VSLLVSGIARSCLLLLVCATIGCACSKPDKYGRKNMTTGCADFGGGFKSESGREALSVLCELNKKYDEIDNILWDNEGWVCGRLESYPDICDADKIRFAEIKCAVGKLELDSSIDRMILLTRDTKFEAVDISSLIPICTHIGQILLLRMRIACLQGNVMEAAKSTGRLFMFGKGLKNYGIYGYMYGEVLQSRAICGVESALPYFSPVARQPLVDSVSEIETLELRKKGFITALGGYVDVMLKKIPPKVMSQCGICGRLFNIYASEEDVRNYLHNKILILEVSLMNENSFSAGTFKKLRQSSFTMRELSNWFNHCTVDQVSIDGLYRDFWTRQADIDLFVEKHCRQL